MRDKKEIKKRAVDLAFTIIEQGESVGDAVFQVAKIYGRILTELDMAEIEGKVRLLKEEMDR